MELIDAQATTPAPVAVVLDTNVVLDWLVFDDPAGRALGSLVEAGQFCWLLCPAMHDELTEVLGRLTLQPRLQRWGHRRAEALAATQRWAQLTTNPPSLPPVLPLKSRDPDDQVFINLAVAHRTRWLFSRDRAILSLARRLRVLGVQALQPSVWLHRQTRTLTPASA